MAPENTLGASHVLAPVVKGKPSDYRNTSGQAFFTVKVSRVLGWSSIKAGRHLLARALNINERRHEHTWHVLTWHKRVLDSLRRLLSSPVTN